MRKSALLKVLCASLFFAFFVIASACVLSSCTSSEGLNTGSGTKDEDNDTVIVSVIPEAITFMGEVYNADTSADSRGEGIKGGFAGYLINRADFEKFSAEHSGAQFAVDEENSVMYAYGEDIFPLYYATLANESVLAVEHAGALSVYVKA